jgi:hypothetical protein
MVKITVHHLILVMILLALIILLLPLVRKEGYTNPSQPTQNPYTIQYSDLPNSTRADYVEFGKRRYNGVADTVNITDPGLLGTEDPQQAQDVHGDLQGAFYSSELRPTSSGKPIAQTTGLGVVGVPGRVGVPPKSVVLDEAKKCEALPKDRTACEVLERPGNENCGVCIKGGTNMRKTIRGNYIGGLFVSKQSRDMAESRASSARVDPVYTPTLGSCPTGYFFMNKEKCIKEANRADCKEIGLGANPFTQAKTDDGKSFSQTSCLACPISGPTVFVHTNKTKRDYTFVVRALTPAGTGQNSIRVLTDGPVPGTTRELGAGQGVGGDEIYIPINSTIKEGQVLYLNVFQEYPHRPRGQPEVFFVKDESVRDAATAQIKCASLDATHATRQQITAAHSAGAQLCVPGFGAGGYIGYPSQGTRDINCETISTGADFINQDSSCGLNMPENKDDNANAQGAWCYGVKPSIREYNKMTGTGTTSVRPFFATYGACGIPSQELRPTKKSQHGDDYEALQYRGIIIQLEISSLSRTDVPTRYITLENTVTHVNDSSVALLDGSGATSVLRRKGTLSQSYVIAKPRADAKNAQFDPQQFWLWGPQDMSSSVKFTCKVPGILADPEYPEDLQTCNRGALASNQEFLAKLQVSTCKSETPGQYGIECLSFLFRSAGGDIEKGTLSPAKNAQNRALALKTPEGANRSVDQILDFYANKVNIAIRGRNGDGTPIVGAPDVRKQTINENAKQMFGMELIFPCETLTDELGSATIINKTGPFDENCLSWLYGNAGVDFDRKNLNTINMLSVAGPTYMSIETRYSGLKQIDFGSEELKKKYPFQTCQKDGTLNPKHVNQTVAQTAILAANAQGTEVQNIQDFYNKIYDSANKTIVGEGTSEEVIAQKNAIKQCFGIEKAVDASVATCGLMARKIRILKPNNANGKIVMDRFAAFDEFKNNITVGKLATSSTNSQFASLVLPQTGRVRTFQTADTDTDPFWEVDLGGLQSIRTIQITVSDPAHELAMRNTPIQLIGTDNVILAQKDYSPKANSTVTVTFNEADKVYEIPLGHIRPGVKLNFSNSNVELKGVEIIQVSPSASSVYLKYGTNYISVVNSVVQLSSTGTEFKIRPAKSGALGTFSIETKTPVGFFWIPDYNDTTKFGSTVQYKKDDTNTRSNLYNMSNWKIVRA